MSTLLFMLWLGSIFLGLYSLRALYFVLKNSILKSSISKRITHLRFSSHEVGYLKELLQSGAAPQDEDWNQLKKIAEPWSQVASLCTKDLRDHGAPCVPTLSRFKTAMDDQIETLLEAQSKSASAWGQIWIGAILIPIVSIFLYHTLQGPQEHLQAFCFAIAISGLLVGISMFWTLHHIHRAQFGNISEKNRHWYPHTLALFERISALISIGTPADLAWKKALLELSQHAPDLTHVWGTSIWMVDPHREDAPPQNKKTRPFLALETEIEKFLKASGTEIRRMIQASLMEGRPVLERLHDQQKAFSVEYRLKLSRELAKLPQQCLKPLFLCVAPAVVILFVTAILLTLPVAEL